MTTIRHRADGALILGDTSGTEIVVETRELENLHQHLGAVLADRAAKMRDIANTV